MRKQTNSLLFKVLII